jgi:hypothetical protein
MTAASLTRPHPDCFEIFVAIGRWMELWTSGPEDPPLCLTCEHEFTVSAGAPRTFAMIYSNDLRVERWLLTGVCHRCAEQPDAKLLIEGSQETCAMFGGEPSDCQASSTVH